MVPLAGQFVFFLGLTYQGITVAAEGISEYKLKDIIIAATDAICYVVAKGPALSWGWSIHFKR